MNNKILKIFIIFTLIVLSYSINSMAFTLVLDPGHGGIDTGARYNTTYEKDLNLKVAKNLKKYLEDYEVNVIMTHEGLASDQNLDIFDRGIFARNQKADLLISLHFNDGNGNGSEVWVSANTTCNKYNKETTELGNKILNKICAYGLYNRGVKTRTVGDESDIYSDGTRADYYGVIRYAMRGCKIDYGTIWPTNAIPANVEKGEGVPALIIEHCFINNDNAFTTDYYTEKFAIADGEAIVEQYGLKKKEVFIPEENVNPQIIISPIKEIADFKIEEEQIIMTPSVKISDLLEKQPNAKVYKISDNEEIEVIDENEKIGTGYKIKIEENEYTAIKYGDSNGDGIINSGDLLKIQKHLLKVIDLTDTEFILAADVNKDDIINSGDLLKIQKYLLKISNLEL